MHDDCVLDGPCVPLTRAILHRAATLPALKPMPLWHSGGHREAWGWVQRSEASQCVQRSEASQCTSDDWSAGYGPRSTLASSTDAHKCSLCSHSLSTESRALDTTAKCLEQQWQVQRMKQLYRKASGSAFDLGWGPGTEPVSEVLMPRPRSSKGKIDDSVLTPAASRGRETRAMSLTSYNEGVCCDEKSRERRRHRFSRALQLAMEARCSDGDGKDEECWIDPLIQQHASLSELLPRNYVRPSQTALQNRSSGWSRARQIWAQMLRSSQASNIPPIRV